MRGQEVGVPGYGGRLHTERTGVSIKHPVRSIRYTYELELLLEIQRHGGRPFSAIQANEYSRGP
jgi:hypothetical protein